MQKFLREDMSATDFVITYLNKFKAKDQTLEDQDFEVLDELFGDADAYTPDCGLIAKDPSFYIDERQLRKRVAVAINKLT